MSLPPELGAVCFQLLNAPNFALLRCLPEMQRQVQRCQVPLSTSSESITKSDPTTAVLVHKLKTCLTSFLNSRIPEQRLTAVVLIKAVIEVGGWEVLRTSEPWVRGLLSVLAV
jgi:pre-rRNA-processing protein RIX1